MSDFRRAFRQADSTRNIAQVNARVGADIGWSAAVIGASDMR
jgi:hypothetical protein